MRGKKITFAIVSLLLGISLCSCQVNQPKSEVKGTTGGTSQYTIVKKPLQLSIHMHVYNGGAFNEEWPVFQKAAELTNVSLKGTVPESATNSQEVFNVMMASGKLPDIVNYLRSDIEKYALQGAFVPLDDYIEKYAPNFKAFLDSRPDIKKSITAADGHIYIIPKILQGNFAKGWFIREDWLKKLNLPVPTTLEQYHNTLLAFKNNDPNGNGSADEIPFFVRDANTATGELYSLFGVKTGWDVVDGKVIYGQNTQQFKVAMTNIAQWYKEGLIDKEIFTRGSNARDSLFGGNTGGTTHDWITSTASYNEKLKDKVPGFSLVVMAPPADINGKIWEESARNEVQDPGWAISRDNKNPIETMKYFDFWFTDAGIRLSSYGIEGVNYDTIDNKPIFKADMVNGKKPLLILLNEVGAQVTIGSMQDGFYEQQIMNDAAKNGVKLYTDNKYIHPLFPTVSLNQQEKKAFDLKWTAIQTYMNETVQKWVLGAEPVEPNFDKYIQQLKAMGMDEVVSIYQQAYDRFIK